MGFGAWSSVSRLWLRQRISAVEMDGGVMRVLLPGSVPRNNQGQELTSG